MTTVTTVSVLAVLAVLVVGLWNMGREESQSLSQKLMRWRVGLQFLAIVLIMATIAVKRGFN
jgi:hypothetical protein